MVYMSKDDDDGDDDNDENVYNTLCEPISL